MHTHKKGNYKTNEIFERDFLELKLCVLFTRAHQMNDDERIHQDSSVIHIELLLLVY